MGAGEPGGPPQGRLGAGGGRVLGYGPQPSFSARPSRRPSATGVGPAPRLRGGVLVPRSPRRSPPRPGSRRSSGPRGPRSPPLLAAPSPRHRRRTGGKRPGRELGRPAFIKRTAGGTRTRGHRTHGHGRPDLQTGPPRVFKHKTCAHLQLSPGSIPQRLRALGVVQVQRLQRGAQAATRAPACGAGRAGFKLILWRLAEDRLRRARSPSRGLPAGEGGHPEERTPGTDSC